MNKTKPAAVLGSIAEVNNNLLEVAKFETASQTRTIWFSPLGIDWMVVVCY